MSRENIDFRDMGFTDGQDISHLFDVSGSFQELREELGRVTTIPDANVAVGDKKYKLDELKKAFETLAQYVDLNKEDLRRDPAMLDRYLLSGFPAAELTNANPILKEAVLRLGKAEV